MGFFNTIGRLWALRYRPLYYLGKVWALIRFGMKHDNFIVNIYSWGCLSWMALLLLIAIDEGDAGILFFGLTLFGLPPLIPIYIVKRWEKPTVEIPISEPRIKKVMEPQKEEITQFEPIAETIIDVGVALDFPGDFAYVGEEARIFARVENKSSRGIEDIELTARFTDILGVDRESVKTNFLAPENVPQLHWTIKPKDAGVYSIYKPTLRYKDESGNEHKQEMDTIHIKVKEVAKEKQKRARAVKRGRKALFSPWCPECNKYKGRQEECPHCGYAESDT